TSRRSPRAFASGAVRPARSSASGTSRRSAARPDAERAGPGLGDRPKTASWVGSGSERGTPRSTPYLHVAAGQAGATVLVRPEHIQTPWNGCVVVRASFAAPAVLAAAWRTRVPPDDSCSPFLSDPRRSLGSAC